MCVEPHSDLNIRMSQRPTSTYDFIDLIYKSVLKELYVSFQISLLDYPMFSHLTSLRDLWNATSVVYPEICHWLPEGEISVCPFLCVSLAATSIGR